MNDNVKKDLDIDDYIKMLEEIYEPIQNSERNFYQVLARVIESIAKCSQYVNKSQDDEIADQLPTLFAWYCSLVVKAKPKGFRLSEILWQKYPDCCPYCLSNPCICPRNKSILDDNLEQLRDKAINNNSRRPHTLYEWQDMFARIYPRNPQGYDQKSNFMHLIEELGETSEAYRLNYFHPDNLDNELADVLTWIFGIANLIDSKAKENFYSSKEYNLEEKIFEKYKDGCPKCKKPHCNCYSEDVKEKISESFHFYPEDVYNLINNLKISIDDYQSEIINEIKEMSLGQSITNENINILVAELVIKSKDKKWYKKLTAQGIAENTIVTLVFLLAQSLLSIPK